MNLFFSKFNWDRHFENKCADEAYDLFRIVCYFSCSKFVPLKKNKPYRSRWINKGIKEAIKLKHCDWRKYINSNKKSKKNSKDIKEQEISQI